MANNLLFLKFNRTIFFIVTQIVRSMKRQHYSLSD